MDEEEKALLDERSKHVAVRIKMDATIKMILLTVIIITAILIIPRIKSWGVTLKKAESKQGYQVYLSGFSIHCWCSY